MKKISRRSFMKATGVASLVTVLTACGGDVTQIANSGTENNENTGTITAAKDDLSKNVELKVNFATGNKSRTMSYNQESPLTLPDGTVVTAGMLKPVWNYVGNALNIKFNDVTTQDQKAGEMIDTASTTAFAGANVFGGEGVAEKLMYYGTEGKLLNLSQKMDEGCMPNFKAYLDKNPDVKSAITAYDGSIYHVPYIAELDNFARQFILRGSWITKILDETNVAYDKNSFNTYYKGAYIGDKVRAGENGGTVTPMEGVNITKKTNQNIIELQNNLDVKNGETLTKTMIQYIADNYDYEKPSQLFLGEKAAYDMDELIALMRCIKANPIYLTEGRADAVWPLFTRHSKYREDLVRMAMYFNGAKVHGSDSYPATWGIDKDGKVFYTYSTPEMYEALCYLSDMEAEGLIYSDCYDLSDKSNFRSTLWGTDSGDAPSFGFLTYDWIASCTADNLNKDTVVVLPPVAKINGVWQYYIDNGRAIKPDGWAISVAGSNDEQIQRACTLFDYYFTKEGHVVQNYGLPDNLVENETYTGPDGVEYPQFNEWMYEKVDEMAKGDVSVFLRDFMGGLMPIGYQKEIGFEYQNTSERGFKGWELMQNSTTGFANYAGNHVKGDNPNYGKMVPPVFSLTERQKENLGDNTSMLADDIAEDMFNVIRYSTMGDAPEGTKVPKNYDEYLKMFTDRGLDLYEETYQQAYEVMKAGK